MTNEERSKEAHDLAYRNILLAGDGRSGLLPDWMIERHVKIEPFVAAQAQEGVISYGVSGYGYDARLGYDFKIFTNVFGPVIDPKNFDPRSFVTINLEPPGHRFEKEFVSMRSGFDFVCALCGSRFRTLDDGNPEHDALLIQEWNERYPCPAERQNYIIIPPNSFALGVSLEYFEIPRDVLAICLGKSTYARCGLVVNVTPLEPEWRGHVTIEISNTTPLPAKVYAGEGIMQILFFKALAVCKTSYADKRGRYQDQAGLTLPFIKKE